MFRVGSLLTIACCGLLAFVCCTVPSASKAPKDAADVKRVAGLPARGDGDCKIQFTDQAHGWLALGKTLWRTVDASKTWQQVYSGEPSWDVTASIDELEFLDSQTGWVLVSDQGIYGTHDAGASWEKLTDPFDGVVHSMKFFKDGKQGWAAGEMETGRDKPDSGSRQNWAGVISHTTDRGKTWRKQAISRADAEAVLYLYFPDEAHGWALVRTGLFYLDAELGIWKKTNLKGGGCAGTMLRETLNPRNAVDYEPSVVSFLDSTQGWLGFQNGFLAGTTDGGKTWCDLLDPRTIWPVVSWDTYFIKIHFANAGQGWALGADNVLYSSNDSGRTWNKVDLKTSFVDMCFTDAGPGWAVSEDGIFIINSPSRK